jgi:hypothetical protein
LKKKNHEIVTLKKTEQEKVFLKGSLSSNGLLDVMPTEYYKAFKTLTAQELSKIRKEFAKTPLIYLWRHKKTKHCYERESVAFTFSLGSSINFSNRLYGYTCVSSISRSNCIIHKAIDKYNYTAFELYILERHTDINKTDLVLREDYWTFLVNPSYNVKRKKYFILNDILYKMPELNANTYTAMVQSLVEKESVFKNRKVKSNYKPLFLFEKNTKSLLYYFYRTDLLCDFISKNRDYVKSRLDKHTTITVNHVE